MVKAPRSKGCRVCVSRRVKCDQRRPFCLRCQKANRQCPGYETINIVDEGPSVRQLYQNVSRAPGEGSSNVGPAIAKTAGRESSPSSVSSVSSETRYEHWAPFEYLHVPDGSLPSTNSPYSSENSSLDLERSTLVAIISPSTYQAQLLASFISSISATTSRKLAPAFHCHSIWMSQIAARPEISSSLTWAIRAIALSHLGLQMQDQNIIQHSRNNYGTALLKLNKSLQDPIEGLTSDTLSATVLLSFYEFMTCTEKNSWVRHAGGAGNLIRLRGPDRHQEGYDSSVFLACRYTLMIEAYHSRKPCFLALPEWKRLSRELQENSEFQSPLHTVREDIWQAVVEIPGFVIHTVHYMTDGSRDPNVLRDLVRQGHHHRSNNKYLQARLIEALRELGQEPTMTVSAENDQLFPYVYQYPGNMVASYYCAHWSQTIMLNIILIGLEAKLSEISSPEPRSPEQDLDVDTGASVPSPQRRGLPLLWMLTDRTRRATYPTNVVGTPSSFPTMSNDDTTRRRQMYMTESISCAREICKSVESMCVSMFLGPMFLVYALRNSLRVLNDTREQEWIIQKLTMISKTFGVAKTEVEIFRQSQAHP